MLRLAFALLVASTTAIAAPKVGEHVGKLGPSGAEQTPAFLLTESYSGDFKAAKKCPLKSSDGDVVYIGRKAVYAEGSQGVVVLLDEYARRYALDYCWK